MLRGLSDEFILHPALRRQEHKPGMLEDDTIPKPRSITQHSHHVAGQTFHSDTKDVADKCWDLQSPQLAAPLMGSNQLPSAGTHQAASKAKCDTTK